HVDVNEVTLVLAALAALAAALTVTAGTPARFLAAVDRNADLALVTKDGVVLDDVAELVLDLPAHAITEPVLVRGRPVTTGAGRRVDDCRAGDRVGAAGERELIRRVEEADVRLRKNQLLPARDDDAFGLLVLVRHGEPPNLSQVN